MKIYVSPTFGVSNYTSTEAYEKRYNDYEPYIVRLKAELRGLAQCTPKDLFPPLPVTKDYPVDGPHSTEEQLNKRFDEIMEDLVENIIDQFRDGACLDELTTNKALQETIRAERAAYEGEGDYQADPQNL
jgi:hypothetical protein